MPAIYSCRVSLTIGYLRLEPGQNAKCLRIALKSAAFSGNLIESAFPIVPKGWVPYVMRQAGSIDNVRVAPQFSAEGSAHLGYFQRMCQTVASKVRINRPHYLRFGREAAERGRVQDARSVPFEFGSALGFRGLWYVP